ncbi:unnamed protein product, partial [Schistocephalus solidus]
MPDDRSASSKQQQRHWRTNNRSTPEKDLPAEVVYAANQTTMPSSVPSSSSSSARSTPDVSSPPPRSYQVDAGSNRDNDRSSSASIYETAHSGSSSPIRDSTKQIASLKEEAPLEAAI